MKGTQDRPLTILQQAALNALLSGTAKNATEACRIAKYGKDMPEGHRKNQYLGQMGHKLVNNGKFKAELDKKRDELAKRIDITLEELTLRFNRLAHKAEAEGNLAEARRCNREIGQNIGYYQADSLPESNLIGKALDAKKAEDMRKFYDKYYAHKYLAGDDIIEAEADKG